MWAGADWTWHKPVLRNDAITTQAYLKDLIEHQTRFAGRASSRSTTSISSTSTATRSPRPTAGCSAPIATRRASAAPNTPKPAAASSRITEEQLAEFYKLYEAEEIRGATPRYWEDVKEGEALPRMMKGPMTVTGFICYAQGWGGLYIRANKLAWKMQSKHPGLGIKNRFDVPDCPERVHWDEEFALEVGAPGAYDYGPERCSWLTHHITNWMGDDGFLQKSKCQIRRHNPDGDVHLHRRHRQPQIHGGRQASGGDSARRPRRTAASFRERRRDRGIAQPRPLTSGKIGQRGTPCRNLDSTIVSPSSPARGGGSAAPTPCCSRRGRRSGRQRPRRQHQGRRRRCRSRGRGRAGDQAAGARRLPSPNPWPRRTAARRSSPTAIDHMGGSIF